MMLNVSSLDFKMGARMLARYPGLTLVGSLAMAMATALLTLFGAAIVGILPALRITKVNVQDALRSENAAGLGLVIDERRDLGQLVAVRSHEQKRVVCLAAPCLRSNPEAQEAHDHSQDPRRADASRKRRIGWA